MQQFSRSLRRLSTHTVARKRKRNIIFMSLEYVYEEKCEKSWEEKLFAAKTRKLILWFIWFEMFREVFFLKVNIHIDVDLCDESLVCVSCKMFLRKLNFSKSAFLNSKYAIKSGITNQKKTHQQFRRNLKSLN